MSNGGYVHDKVGPEFTAQCKLKKCQILFISAGCGVQNRMTKCAKFKMLTHAEGIGLM